LVKKKKAEEKLKKIFGSFKAMNYYTFQRFMQTEGNEEACDFAYRFDSKKDNLYMWGPTGVGKTHLAYAAAKMYALAGKNVVVSTPLRMVDSFRTKSELEKEDRFEEFTECDLLLIDDLGISKYTDFGLEVLCEILNRRTLQMRNGLIVTSNLSLDHLAKRNNDARLASRLSGICTVIELRGDDYRLKGR
jgi:DNA replication protein DnaC